MRLRVKLFTSASSIALECGRVDSYKISLFHVRRLDGDTQDRPTSDTPVEVALWLHTSGGLSGNSDMHGS